VRVPKVQETRHAGQRQELSIKGDATVLREAPTGSRVSLNAGATKLRATGKSQKEIARRVGFSQAIVAKWLTGARRPPGPARAKLEHAYNIPPISWEEEHGVTNGVAPAVVLDDAWTPAEFRARAARLQRTIDTMLDEAMHMDPMERRDTVKTCTASMQILGRLTGELNQWDEARILRFPAIRRVHERILEALKGFPPALEAVAKVLAEMSAA
jgi:transcriptional regulator with XRE-family HTH domain